MHQMTTMGKCPLPLSGKSAPLHVATASHRFGHVEDDTVVVSNPPLSVILELTGPVHFEKSLESNANGASTATLVLQGVTPDATLAASPGVRQVDFQRLQGIERFFGNDR